MTKSNLDKFGPRGNQQAQTHPQQGAQVQPRKLFRGPPPQPTQSKGCPGRGRAHRSRWRESGLWGAGNSQPRAGVTAPLGPGGTRLPATWNQSKLPTATPGASTLGRVLARTSAVPWSLSEWPLPLPRADLRLDFALEWGRGASRSSGAGRTPRLLGQDLSRRAGVPGAAE